MKDKEVEDLENIFNLSLDLLCIATPEGKIIKANPAFTECIINSKTKN